jgi:hypothetical protein
MHLAPAIPGSVPILPRRHEQFARMVALHASAAAAYKKHINPTAKDESLWMAASRLTKTDKVAMRIQYLRSQAGKVALKNFGLDTETLVGMHLQIISTPIGEIDANHPLCVKIKRSRRLAGAGEEKSVWEVEEVSKPCISRSLEALANLTGANAPMKSEVTATASPPAPTPPLQSLLRGPGFRAAVIRELARFEEGIEEMRKAVADDDAGLGWRRVPTTNLDPVCPS